MNLTGQGAGIQTPDLLITRRPSQRNGLKVNSEADIKQTRLCNLQRSIMTRQIDERLLSLKFTTFHYDIQQSDRIILHSRLSVNPGRVYSSLKHSTRKRPPLITLCLPRGPSEGKLGLRCCFHGNRGSCCSDSITPVTVESRGDCFRHERALLPTRTDCFM